MPSRGPRWSKSWITLDPGYPRIECKMYSSRNSDWTGNKSLKEKTLGGRSNCSENKSNLKGICKRITICLNPIDAWLVFAATPKVWKFDYYHLGILKHAWNIADYFSANGFKHKDFSSDEKEEQKEGTKLKEDFHKKKERMRAKIELYCYSINAGSLLLINARLKRIFLQALRH